VSGKPASTPVIQPDEILLLLGAFLAFSYWLSVNLFGFEDTGLTVAKKQSV
jgi:hypothetical protein